MRPAFWVFEIKLKKLVSFETSRNNRERIPHNQRITKMTASVQITSPDSPIVGVVGRSPAVNQMFRKIESLDFTELKAKLMLPGPEGYGWTKEQADSAELWYKRFLMLHLLHPKHPNSPSVPVDMFWHAHILDTRRYAKDCQDIFGHFVHHFPYFGLRDDKAELQTAFGETNLLYQKEFGANAMLGLIGAGHAADCCDPCSTDEGDDDGSND